MARAYIGIGSNIDPAANVERCLRILSEKVSITGLSSIYVTRPVGRPEQEPYYNCVAEIETALPPLALKRQVLRAIEDALGRKRGHDRYAARTIDLDLVLYDELVMTSEDLVLPDPDILLRPFLAVPLLELAPRLNLPGSGRSLAGVAANMRHDDLRRLADFTENMRKEIIHGG
jgi:2-amino-4-hydroxy-6-hydroxymethyldihydropteridine diphosphokinase